MCDTPQRSRLENTGRQTNPDGWLRQNMDCDHRVAKSNRTGRNSRQHAASAAAQRTGRSHLDRHHNVLFDAWNSARERGKRCSEIVMNGNECKWMWMNVNEYEVNECEVEWIWSEVNMNVKSIWSEVNMKWSEYEVKWIGSEVNMNECEWMWMNVNRMWMNVNVWV